VRRGALPLVTAAADAAVAPVWSEELGPPHCRGIRVLETDFSSAYFFDLAQKQAAEYVAKGELERGDRYSYRLCAYPAESRDADTGASKGSELEFGVEPVADPIALGDSAVDDFLARSEAVDEADAPDAPVFVAREVIDEVRALARRAGELETGGALVGLLHRDPLRPEVFVEVTAQIPARHAEARGASFAFTPETWSAADAALALRGGREICVGWWHFHPLFCRACPAERRATCAFARPFFSAEDQHLHRTCFPQAWQQALLVSDLPETGLTPALFGWRLGKIVRRGYGLLHRDPGKEEV